MNVKKINRKHQKKRILIAPLDWGLGHATRCIPVIELLLHEGAEVIIAAETAVADLLKKEFPEIIILPLKGYRIRYCTGEKFFRLKMLLQIPGIINTIQYEKKWLNDITPRYRVDGVISDNRFGFYSTKIPSVFITHQLFIKTGNNILNSLVQKINYRYIRQFNECWVADAAGINNLAGDLSHPLTLPPVPLKYSGILSRCKIIDVEKTIEILVMISGPEPQRSIFEKILLPQLKDINGPVIFIRGLPEIKSVLIPEGKNISIFNHLPATVLNEVIQRSKLVIARCGYSTIMDLVVLKQKAILVPTPGQTEQEYLANYLKEKKIFFTVQQKGFSLKKEIENVSRFDFETANNISLANNNMIIDWLRKLPSPTPDDRSISPS